MRKLYLKFYRFILNDKYYPFNIWVFILGVFLFSFLNLVISGILFFNFITNSDFYEGLKISFVFSIIVTFITIIIILNPFQLIKILYDTLEKVTDGFLVTLFRFFRK